MKTSLPETNDNSRDDLSLIVLSFVTAATWVVGCVALYGLFRLSI